jgi:hypothetical protein
MSGNGKIKQWQGIYLCLGFAKEFGSDGEQRNNPCCEQSRSNRVKDEGGETAGRREESSTTSCTGYYELNRTQAHAPAAMLHVYNSGPRPTPPRPSDGEIRPVRLRARQARWTGSEGCSRTGQTERCGGTSRTAMIRGRDSEHHIQSHRLCHQDLARKRACETSKGRRAHRSNPRVIAPSYCLLMGEHEMEVRLRLLGRRRRHIRPTRYWRPRRRRWLRGWWSLCWSVRRPTPCTTS